MKKCAQFLFLCAFLSFGRSSTQDLFLFPFIFRLSCRFVNSLFDTFLSALTPPPQLAFPQVLVTHTTSRIIYNENIHNLQAYIKYGIT